MCCYVAACIDCGLFPAQLDDLANETDGAVCERVEVGEVDAGGGDCFGHGWLWIRYLDADTVR